MTLFICSLCLIIMVLCWWGFGRFFTWHIRNDPMGGVTLICWLFGTIIIGALAMAVCVHMGLSLINPQQLPWYLLGTLSGLSFLAFISGLIEQPLYSDFDFLRSLPKRLLRLG